MPIANGDTSGSTRCCLASISEENTEIYEQDKQARMEELTYVAWIYSMEQEREPKHSRVQGWNQFCFVNAMQVWNHFGLMGAMRGWRNLPQGSPVCWDFCDFQTV
eukprot:1140788-Pelagomonas_calceolata.AAC.1